MNENLMRKYAKLAVCSGVNVQKGQLLVINGSVKDYKFIEMCVEEAYKAGAGEVTVNWSDELITKLAYENCSLETLCEFPQWQFDKKKSEIDKKCCYLSVASRTPGLLKDIDPKKLRDPEMIARKKMAPLADYTRSNHGQWCILALPCEGWANTVFPELETEEAMDKLAEAIFEASRVTEDNDPVEAWHQHSDNLLAHGKVLDENKFETLHFYSESTGTDLNVGIVKNHLWVGGCCYNDDGVQFIPNIPTEEIFCMPQRDRVNGKVFATKPLSYGGKVIKDFWFEFKDGAVIDYGAANDVETLKNLLDTDEGSRRLGEVALISYDSPISLMNILFYNTLFDENASCHLALGACYPENLVGGTQMSEEEVIAHGGNNSVNHVDFMFGSRDMQITGIREDGSEVTVFENGNFVF